MEWASDHQEISTYIAVRTLPNMCKSRVKNLVFQTFKVQLSVTLYTNFQDIGRFQQTDIHWLEQNGLFKQEVQLVQI